MIPPATSVPMAMFLEQAVGIDRWFDLESLLKRFASNDVYYGAADPEDEEFFHVLRGALTDYLKQEEQKSLRTEATAARVLKSVLANGYFTSIYSFNYTDLHGIARLVGVGTPFNYEHVHGSIADNSIIVGIDAHSDVRDGYSYLRKINSEHYRSHQIRYDLQECDEVIFFGHSLGDIDYPYFYDFFSSQSHCSSRSDGKYITIFTKDNRSRFQILDQLRSMNGGETEHLQNDNYFKLIMTDAPDPVLMNQFFSHLEKDSVKSNDTVIMNLASEFSL